MTGSAGVADRADRRKPPTWRDLPPEPPFGPIRPFLDRLPGRGRTAPEPVEGEESRITPAQIALTVGGILLLLALGVGAALLLLDGDEQDQAQDSPLPVESDQPDSDGDPFGQLTPAPGNPDPQPPGQPDDQDDDVAGGEDGQDDSPEQGQGGDDPTDPEPVQPPGDGDAQPPGGGEAQPPEGDLEPQEPGGDAAPQEPGEGQAPDQGSPAPGPQPPSDLQEPDDGQVELARLFELRQLPTQAEEADTTVTQTTSDDTEATIEQVTRLTHPDGDITVTGHRGTDARARHDELVDGDAEAEEVSVRGQPAFVLEGQRLVWLVEGDPATFLSIDAPATVGIDEVLTIANGMELDP